MAGMWLYLQGLGCGTGGHRAWGSIFSLWEKTGLKWAGLGCSPGKA